MNPISEYYAKLGKKSAKTRKREDYSRLGKLSAKARHARIINASAAETILTFLKGQFAS